MKVLFIMPWSKIREQLLFPGISGTLRPAFACKKVKIDSVILSDHVEGLTSESSVDGIKIHRLPKMFSYPLGEFSRRVFALSQIARKIVEKEQIDLIHCFFGTNYFTYFGAYGLTRLRKPLILLFDYCFYYRRKTPENFSLYSTEPVGTFVKDRIEKHLMLKILNKATYVQTPSLTVKKFLELDMQKENITYIPYTVDTDLFSPEKDTGKLREKFDLENELLITYLYGHDEFLHQFVKHLAPKIEGDFKFFFPGPFKKEVLLKLLGEKGLRDKSVVPGMLDAQMVPEAIDTSDICLSFEVGATIFTKTLEYASCGRPVVSLFSPGVEEVVRHRKEALISSSPEFAGNEEFVEYVEWLINDAKLRERLGKNARKRILRGYSYDVVGKMFWELFESCLKK